MDLLSQLVSIFGLKQEKLFLGEDYVLTCDNFLKCLLIMLRVRSKIPVILMGETGCGKTSLIKFLALKLLEVKMETINFHAGITTEDIIEKMNKFEKDAMKLKFEGKQLWVFLDEINTCDSLGLLSEIMTKKSVQGRMLPDNIQFIAACNPYRVKSQKRQAGLVKKSAATILTYTVNPLPDSIIDYVWDYGSLSQKEEEVYVRNMFS